MTGCVYFIRATESGRIKIGWCRGDPGKRLRTLQCGSPEPLELLGWWRNSPQELERAYHRLFADARLHGEWFWPIPALAELAGYRHLGRYMPGHDELTDESDHPLPAGLA